MRCRVLVERGIDPARPGLVDQPQRVDASAPVRLADDLVMGHLRRKVSLLADGDGVAHAVQDPPASSRMCDWWMPPDSPATDARSITSWSGA